MAWITVDQKLIGGKLRDFAKKSGISQNEAIGILIRLWLWGLDNTDKDGRIVAADREDIEEAIRPGFLETNKRTVSMIVDNLISTGWIDLVDDVMYLHDWVDWRSAYSSYVDKKAKHAERMRNYRAEKAKENAKEEKPLTPEKPEPKAREKKEYAVAFEKFWKVYPRKVDKGNAYKKYQARLNDGYSDAELLQAATNYANQCRRDKTEAKYIKHPKTFLSDTKPFIDFLDKTHQEPEKVFQKGENPFQNGENPFRKGENPFR